MALRMPLLVLVLLASGCNQQADPGVPTKPVVRDSTEGSQQIAPRIDYHQHLASPAEAGLWNGTRLPEIELPAAVAQALRSRGELVKDKSALAKLFTHDAVVLNSWSPGARWMRGRTAVTGYLTAAFGGAHRLVPQAYRADGAHAHVVGYYTRAKDGAGKPFGYFQIALERGDDGQWRVAAESPTFPSDAAVQAPITAEKLIMMLDEAGIHRAVVLSDAFLFGGKSDMESESTVPHDRVRAENDWTAQQIAQYPTRLVAFCSFNPLVDYAIAELDRCAKDGRFRGLKLHLWESRVDLQNVMHVKKLREVFVRANEHRLPIIVHVGNNESKSTAADNVQTFLHEIVAAAPDVVVQIAHLWGGQGFSAEALGAYARAVSTGDPAAKNLYFDVAEVVFVTHLQGISDKALPEVASAIRQIGLERILYGSDGALVGHATPAEGWAQFRKEVPLTDAEFDTIANNIAPYMRDE